MKVRAATGEARLRAVLARHEASFRLLLAAGALAMGSLGATEAPAPPPYAWYRADQGVERIGPHVHAWTDTATSPSTRSLNRVVGHPRAVRVKTPAGEATIVRLDGASALWQTAGGWGQLSGGFTVIAYLRPHADARGFLFDGSTRTSASKVRFAAGQWLAGPGLGGGEAAASRSTSATAPPWAMHAFVFETTGQAPQVRHFSGDQRQPEILGATEGLLAGFMLGADFAGQNTLRIDLAEVIVFAQPLRGPEIAAQRQRLEQRWGQPEEIPGDLPGAELPDDPRIFRQVLRRQGQDGVHTSRIPGLAATARGTLLAVFDLRHKAQSDLPADIDVGLMRSVDRGATWSQTRVILDFDRNAPESRGNGVGDPCILVDRERGTIFVAALWSYGDRAWKGSGPGLSPAQSGQFVLTRSDDDGLTWSAPINITAQVKDARWRLCFQGPGAGIQLRDGTLVFPAQYRDDGAESAPHSCFVWSSDHGANWRISAAAVATTFPTSEAQIAELPDGGLLLTMRNEQRIGRRAWARYDWSGDLGTGKWSDPWFTVPDPTCQASLLRHSSGLLLLSHPNSATQRVAMSVRGSRDGGRTWSEARLVDPRPSSYSCLTELPDGDIGLLYECGDNYAAETLTFVRFPLAWIATESP